MVVKSSLGTVEYPTLPAKLEPSAVLRILLRHESRLTTNPSGKKRDIWLLTQVLPLSLHEYKRAIPKEADLPVGGNTEIGVCRSIPVTDFV